MKKKMILLIWLTSISFIGFSQDFRKVGLGIGYHTTSIVGDSVRPFELSLRYRIDNTHTLQVYAPLWLKKEEQKLKDAKPNFMKQEKDSVSRRKSMPPANVSAKQKQARRQAPECP